MRRRWLVAGVLAGAAGAAVISSTLDDDAGGPILAAVRTAAVRPMVWHGRFETVNRHAVQRACDRLLTGTPDLSAGFEEPHHPIQTGADWLAYGPHTYGHWSNCREALYAAHFSPVAHFRGARPSRVTHLAAFRVEALTLNEIPPAQWGFGPADPARSGPALADAYPATTITRREPRTVWLELRADAAAEWYTLLGLTEVGRADFDGDGCEDVLLRFHWDPTPGSTFSWGHTIVSRTAPDGALIWRVEAEGSH